MKHILIKKKECKYISSFFLGEFDARVSEWFPQLKSSFTDQCLKRIGENWLEVSKIENRVNSLEHVLICMSPITFQQVIREFKKTTTATATGTSLNKGHFIAFLCRPLQNNNVKWLNFTLSVEREPTLLLCSGSSFTIALTVINKVNDYRVSRAS